MRLIFKRAFLLLLMPLVFTSCIGTRHSANLPLSTLNRNTQTHILMDMDDFEVVAEVEDSISYSVYLGVFTTNRDYRNTRRVVVSSNALGGGFNPLSQQQYANRLLYRMYEAYPEADLIIPTVVKEEQLRLFLGSRRTVRVKARVLKLK